MAKHIDYEKENELRVWWLNNTGGSAHDGLTVRDYFATSVMATLAMLSKPDVELATRAYQIADAMMKERAK